MTSRLACLGGLLLVVGCTKSNPAAKCSSNGTCTDPNFPFCDVDGSIGGEAGTCIAVQCMPGSFGSCADANTALICNSIGESYDKQACINGCDSKSGCVTCTANTKSCSNNVTTSCDAMGRISMQTCAIGCSTDATHCLELVPSNGLGQYYGLAMPQDLSLASGTLDLDTSMFDDGTTKTMLQSFDVAAPIGGSPIRVFVAKHLTLGDVTILSTNASTNKGVGYAVAFLATGDIDVTGRVVVQTGAYNEPGCSGGTGLMSGSCTGGSGGGAFASVGGAGGNAGGAIGGIAGGASGTIELVPLRGGCPGGGFSAAGGAIQLTSQTAVHITGLIILDGLGGGAGGGALIEAQSVSLGATARILARGGAGGGGNLCPPPPPDDATPFQGCGCKTGGGVSCGVGGAGASNGTGAGNGQSTTCARTFGGAGGGGGGYGRVRINTLDATVTIDPAAVMAGLVTTGRVVTQ